MSVQLVRFTAIEAHVADIETAIKTMLAAIEKASPSGTRYALCKLPDGVTFLGFLNVEGGSANPLLDIPEALEFRENLKNWTVAPQGPPEPLEVIGSYNLFT